MLHDIPTHLVTGFLGSGKTTVIHHLLAQKPDDERWAVLVNEFGETGIDAALLGGTADGVYIREVPGGCMCCAAGVPMQVALNQLLGRARPHRLLIEPTGLGHAGALIRTLTRDALASVLDLRAIVALVDARRLTEQRYREHPIFRQQLEAADRIVASKADLYTDADDERLQAFLDEHPELRERPHTRASKGKLPLDWLDKPGQRTTDFSNPLGPASSNPAPATPEPEAELPASGFQASFNTGEGHASAGWRFAEDSIFDRHRIEQVIRQHPAQRIKGVVHTEAGRLRINRDHDTVTLALCSGTGESRIEFIADREDALAGTETQLRGCLRT